MLVQTAWLFTRASQSVRIVRAVARTGVMHIVVQGPGDERETHEFTDAIACASYQAELERRLVSQGYSLEEFTTDRRDSTATGQRIPERRRLSQLFL